MKEVTTAEPLRTSEVFYLTKADACTVMGDYKVRIMNMSPNQTISVVDVVEWKGYYWGIKPISTPQERYEYLAVRVEKP